MQATACNHTSLVIVAPWGASVTARAADKATSGAPAPTVSGTRRAIGFGKYRLFARLGAGGMADVYLALAQGTMNVNRLVVIKRLREEEAGDASVREMFLDEARLAARLNHPNVIQTFEAGEEGGSLFFAMEYVEGQPLSRILTALTRAGKTLEPRTAARICADALSGLHYAHELRDFDGTALEIVHRDVSPQNIMVTYEGAVKLVDFGIAKAIGTTQTAHGVFKGKAAFMAPEQVRCEEVDRRADIFAAGIVLWESLTGSRLMSESTPAATLYNVMTKAIRPPSELNAQVPPELDAIVLRALRRDAAERFQTAKDMRDALDAFVTSKGGVTPDEVGEITRTMFADTREKVLGQIKSQLAALSFGRASESGRHLTQDLGQTQVRQMTNVLVEIDDGVVETSASASASLLHVVTTSGKASRAQRFALVAWFAIPVLALAASAVALLRSPSAAPALATTTTTAAAPSITAPSPGVATVATPTANQAGAAPTTGQAAAPASQASTPDAAPHAALPARAAPAFVPFRAAPVAPTIPATTATTAEAPKASAAPAVAPRAQEPAQGRTFRRDL